MSRIIVGVLGGLVTLVGVLLALSRGKPRPVADANGQPVPGSLSEKTWVNIYTQPTLRRLFVGWTLVGVGRLCAVVAAILIARTVPNPFKKHGSSDLNGLIVP